MIQQISVSSDVANWRSRAICLNLLKQTYFYTFYQMEVFSSLNSLVIQMVKVMRYLQFK